MNTQSSHFTSRRSVLAGMPPHHDMAGRARLSRGRSFGMAAIIAASLMAGAAHAAVVTWTGATGGDWNTGTNWSTTPNAPVTADTALFNTSVASVLNAAGVGITSISFDTSADTSALGTTGTPAYTLANSGTVQILSSLSGTGKTISINAPIVLTPASTTTAGAYTFANDSASATNTLNFGGPISASTTNNTETLTLSGANTGNNKISGNITNGSATTFAVAKSGAGTWVLSGTNTYNGGTTISNGTLTTTAAAGLGTGTATVNTGGTLFVDNSGGGAAALTVANAISGSGLVKAKASGANGSVSLNGSFSGFTGTIDILAAGGLGMVILNSNTSVPSASATIIVENGGTVRVVSGQTYNSNLQISGLGDGGGLGALRIDGNSIWGGTVTLLNNAGIGTNSGTANAINGVIGDGGLNYTLSKMGLATLSLNNTNTYGGKTIIRGGTLNFNSGNVSATAAQALGANAAVDLNWTADSNNTSTGATLNYTGAATTLAKNINALSTTTYSNTIQNSGTGLLTLTGTLTNNGTILTLNGGANGITVSGTGTIAGTSAGSNLVVNGGTATLATANTYTGTTTVQAGSLVAGVAAPSGSAGAFGNATSALVLGNTSTLAGDAPSVLINGAYTVGRDITVGSLSNSAAYNATIGGSNTTGIATYTGSITLNTTATAYTATLQAATGGTVDFSTGTWTTHDKAIAIGSSGKTGTVQLDNAITTSGGISVNYGTLALNSAFTGNMAVASGATLSGTAGSVSGTTGVTGGTISGTGLTLTGVTTFNGAGNTLSGTVTSTSGVALASGAALANNGALTGNMTVGSGTLSGTGSVSGTTGVTGGTVNGTGLVLTGATTFSSGSNTLSGSETASGGVTVSTGASLANSATVTGGATINGTLTGTGSFSAASTLGGGTINLTSGGSFGSTLGVTGTSAWNGAGSVTGAVNETGGTFTIGSGANLNATGGLNVSGSATLAGSGTVTGNVSYSSTGTSTYNGVIAGAGKTLAVSNGSLTLGGTNTYGGGTTLTAGTLVLASNSAAGNSAAAVTLSGSSAATLQINSGVTIANNITVSDANATITRQVAASGNYSVGTGGTLASSLGGTNTAASILAGTNSSGSLDTITLSFQNTSGANNDTIRTSDVFILSGVHNLGGNQTDLFVLELNASTVAPGNFIGWINSSNSWVNAVSGNTGNNATVPQQGYAGAFSSFQTTYGSTLSNYVGAYGVDVGNGNVWAVLNHNSDFGVVPEPATWGLLAFSLTTVMVLRRRRRE